LFIDSHVLLQLRVLALLCQANTPLVVDVVQSIERLADEERQRERKEEESTLAVTEHATTWL
jgi:hypothetical protein